jgi:hypothetical protein
VTARFIEDRNHAAEVVGDGEEISEVKGVDHRKCLRAPRWRMLALLVISGGLVGSAKGADRVTLLEECRSRWGAQCSAVP